MLRPQAPRAQPRRGPELAWKPAVALAPLTLLQRRRMFLFAGPASLLALGGFLNAAGLLPQRWWVLPVMLVGLLFSYWLPRRFQFNAGLFALLVAFIVAGIRIAALREEMDSMVLFRAYEWIAVLLVLVSSFKVFGRLDFYFMLGSGALLCIAACAIAPETVSFAAAAGFALLASVALWPSPRRRPPAAER